MNVSENPGVEAGLKSAVRWLLVGAIALSVGSVALAVGVSARHRSPAPIPAVVTDRPLAETTAPAAAPAAATDPAPSSASAPSAAGVSAGAGAQKPRATNPAAPAANVRPRSSATPKAEGDHSASEREVVTPTVRDESDHSGDGQGTSTQDGENQSE